MTMAEMKQIEDQKIVLMEGMYNGVANKIEEARSSVCREMQYNATQQASSYDAIATSLKEGVQSVLNEIRYLAEQNSDIFEYNQKDREKTKEALVEEIKQTLDASLKASFEEFSKQTEAQVKALFEENNERNNQFLIEEMKKLFAEAEEKNVKRDEELREMLRPVVDLFVINEEEAEELASDEVVEEVVGEEAEDGFDYNLLAEKIASVLPEVDYDLVVDRVAAAIPAVDENAIVDKIAATLPQMDENSIANAVVDNLTPVDYDLIAERVVAVVESSFDVRVDEEGVTKIANVVAESLDYERIAQRVAELLSADDKDIERALAVAVAPAPVPVAVEEEEVAEETPAQEEVAVSDEYTTRLKRSFTAKMIQSEDEIKEYYNEIKNALLSYKKVRSQINWTNDRFAYGRETIAKVGIRGKTLCLYLALIPEEFPETVYHQKFAGDAKMYEKTPMMVKIRSGIALKRAIRLIEMLMEREGAVEAKKEKVDYTADFAFQDDEALLQAGLIKTSEVKKTELNF